VTVAHEAYLNRRDENGGAADEESTSCGPFSREIALRDLPLESMVRLDGSFGNLTLHNNASRPAVLLAGGIGVTPFRSMAFRAARERLPHWIFPFCSNRRPEDAPFLEELKGRGANGEGRPGISTGKRFRRA
jgi:ferredoxin-NADP reductase